MMMVADIEKIYVPVAVPLWPIAVPVIAAVVVGAVALLWLWIRRQRKEQEKTPG